MEGGDTWYYDEATPVHSMFNIDGIEDGSDDLGTLLGQSSTFTDGMSFGYSGDKNWIDRINPLGDAFTIFKNQSPSYNAAIANDAGTYKTIGASFEFGGLSETSTTTNLLMHKYLEFFGIASVWVGVSDDEARVADFGQAYPNPFTGKTSLNLTLEESTHIRIEVYNINGQKVNTLVDAGMLAGQHTISWDAEADGAPEGIYFLRLITNDESITRKVILMK